MKKILLLAIIIFGQISIAYAACTKPSGRYAATTSGLWYNTDTNYVTNAFATTITVNFASNGSATGLEIGKRMGALGTGRYSSNWTVSSIGTAGHSFDTTTCRGYITNSDNNSTFVYVSTNSGAKLSGTYYGNDNLLFISNVVFEKL